MSEPLKPGDVCEVIGACCDKMRALMIGRECTVVPNTEELGLAVCHSCYFSSTEYLDVSTPEGIGRVHPSWLRKLPPKVDDQGEPRIDRVPAIEDDWKNIGWHPSKTRAPA